MEMLDYRVLVRVIESKEFDLLLLQNLIFDENENVLVAETEAAERSTLNPLPMDELSMRLGDTSLNEVHWDGEETLLNFVGSTFGSLSESKLEDAKLECFFSLQDYLLVQTMSAEELFEEYQHYTGSRALVGVESFDTCMVELTNGDHVLLKTLLTKVSPKTRSTSEKGWSYFWDSYLLSSLFQHPDAKALDEHLEVLLRVARWKDDYLVFSPDGIQIVDCDLDYISSSSSIKEAIITEYLPLLEDFRDGNNADHLTEGIEYIKQYVMD